MDINRVTIIGRLTKDAELKYTSTGAAFSKVSIAVNKRVKRGDNWENETSFFNVMIWGKTAESLNQYLIKGKQICIDGELTQNRWTTEDGQQRSAVEIKAINIQLLGGRNES